MLKVAATMWSGPTCFAPDAQNWRLFYSDSMFPQTDPRDHEECRMITFLESTGSNLSMGRVAINLETTKRSSKRAGPENLLSCSEKKATTASLSHAHPVVRSLDKCSCFIRRFAINQALRFWFLIPTLDNLR